MMDRRRWRTWAGVAVLAVLVVAAAVVLIARTQRTTRSPGSEAPSADPFYAPPAGYGAAAPGTILRRRALTPDLGSDVHGISGTQLLVRTVNQLGQPDATAVTVLTPGGESPGQVKLLSYQPAYDGLSASCRPSYLLAGGQAPANSSIAADRPIIAAFLAHGISVVSTDYEGSTDDFGAGRQSGEETLDGIRAAEHQLGLPATQPVGLLGYSGGSIATMWAAQEQPSYAPELHLNGVAAGGIPADLAHTVTYVDGSTTAAGAIPAIVLGLFRAYHLSLADYLNARGLQITSQVAQDCFDANTYPGLTLASILKPADQDWQKVPALVRIVNDSIMGKGATPRAPLLMAVGNSDGTGDGIIVAADDQQLAYEYCQRGDDVQFSVYRGLAHIPAFIRFLPAAAAFLGQVDAHVTPTSGCRSIARGNPLTPLP